LFEIQGNPEAMRFTYCAPDRAATERYVEAYSARFVEDGFAPWVAVCKTDRRVVGWGGLNRDPGAPQWGPEVSYFLHPSYWGRGLASELVRASVDLAFRELKLAALSAFTKAENQASARVLRKAGFWLVSYISELDRDRYSLTAPDWRKANRQEADGRR
jgi:RimJ/RimL family protein N-acetyltransferase